MGNGFRIELIGENHVDIMKIWGAMYGGSVTFTGTGMLFINQNENYDMGLLLECEDSMSCVMVEDGVTVEIYGEQAVMIHRTLLENGIYLDKNVILVGGMPSAGEVVDETEDGNPVYDFTVVDEEGNIAHFVAFKPSE